MSLADARLVLQVSNARGTMSDIGRVRNLFSTSPSPSAPASAPPTPATGVTVVGDPLVAAVRRSASGDQAAFEEVYRELAPLVYGTVLRILRDPAMSEEVTQEVFVELWRQAPRYEPDRGSPRTWAATIAHRRAVDRVRSEQSSRNREEADSRSAERERDDVVDEVVDRLDRTEVVVALGRLSAAQREAVVLAYYGGHTYREVAVILGVPEGTIKTRIRDGLSTLRDLMGVAP